jgi:ribonuclease HI
MTNHNQQPVSACPIVMHTDGSCLGNPGPMGWAYHIQWADGAATEKADALGNGTNNKAELLAAIDGLKATPTGSLVLILTDSNYVRRGATEWSTDWVENNWKNAKKKTSGEQRIMD